MTRTAIIAALPGELKPLVRGWQHESRNGVDLWRWQYGQGEWIAACAGAGVDAATRAFAEAEQYGPATCVLSVGWAGALNSDFKPGLAYRVTGVIDARTGERFETADCAAREEDGRAHPSRKDNDAARVGHPKLSEVGHPESSQVGHPSVLLVTSSKVADHAEKQRLAASYGAGLVDMEAAAVARLAEARGIPFACCKGVSDGFTDQLPDFNRFISENGKFQLFRFIVFVLVRPSHWPALIRMGENSKKAAQGIGESLLDILDEEGFIRKRNAYPNRRS
jgi:adenosylhomocysteine nucleosidase